MQMITPSNRILQNLFWKFLHALSQLLNKPKSILLYLKHFRKLHLEKKIKKKNKNVRWQIHGVTVPLIFPRLKKSLP